MSGPCPSPAVWQKFLEGIVAEGERFGLEQHYDDCRDCRDTLGSLSQGAGFQPNPRPLDTPRIPRAAGDLLSFAIQYSPFDTSRPLSAAVTSTPVLPGYNDLQLIGRGGVGTVYRAIQASLGRIVAIKVLSAEAVQRGYPRIRGEAQALARLRHPHIVSIYESGMIDNSAYLVMEWIAGGTLQDQIDEGPLPPREVAQLLRQLAAAVEGVHSLGIVHRDLKPANVLLDRQPPDSPQIAKLTDFGLAQDHTQGQRLTVTGTIVGTPSYMAPEQTGLVPELGVAGTASDIYGLGAVAFAALTGHPPHHGKSTLDTLVRVAWDEPAWIPNLRPEVPSELAMIIAKCLRQRPSDRYRTAGDLAADLDRFLEGHPISARPYSARERFIKWVRRRPAQATSTGLLFLLLTGGVLGTSYHLWTQSQNIQALEMEKQKVDTALQATRHAVVAEKQARLETLQQLKLAAEVTLRLIEDVPQVTRDHWELLEKIRDTLSQQVFDREHQDAAAAEVAATWLSAISIVAEKKFGKLSDAQDALDLALDIARLFPDDPTLRDLEAQILIMSWNQAARLDQPERNSEALSGLLSLCARAQSKPGPGLSPNKAVFVSSTLWKLQQPEAALQLTQSVIARHRAAPENAAVSEADWGALFTLLTLQCQIQLQVGDHVACESTLQTWNEMQADYVRLHPPNLASQLRREFQLLESRLILAQLHGRDHEIPRFLQRAKQLLAEMHRQAPDAPDCIMDRLQLLSWMNRLPDGSIDRAHLDTEMESALAEAADILRNQPHLRQLQMTADDLRSQWSRTSGTIP